MNKIFPLLSILLLFISSCDREEFLGKRLVGSWVYERACYQEKAFRQTDIIDDYKDLVITFKNDGSIEIINTLDSITYSGIFKIDNDYNTNPDGTTNAGIDLVLSYENNFSGEKFLEVWDQSNIGNKKIRYQQRINDRESDFILIKQ